MISLTFASGGRSVTTLDSAGVVLHRASRRKRDCTIADRNPTREEWSQYIGDPDSPTFPYHATCTELPLPVERNVATPVGEGAVTEGAVPATPPISQETV